MQDPAQLETCPQIWLWQKYPREGCKNMSFDQKQHFFGILMVFHQIFFKSAHFLWVMKCHESVMNHMNLILNKDEQRRLHQSSSPATTKGDIGGHLAGGRGAEEPTAESAGGAAPAARAEFDGDDGDREIGMGMDSKRSMTWMFTSSFAIFFSGEKHEVRMMRDDER